MEYQILSIQGWRLYESQPVAGSTVLDFSPQSGIPLSESGDINASLRDAGQMPDPHFDCNCAAYEQVTASNWWIRGVFSCAVPPDPSAELTFMGIDGTAVIFLNGVCVGTAANAFRPHVFRVGELLREEDNVLLLHFPSIDGLLGGPRVDEQDGWGERRTLLRKPQFNMGWDWAQPVPSWGLCGQIRIAYQTGCRLMDARVQSFIDGRVDCFCEVSEEAVRTGCTVEWTIWGEEFEKTCLLPCSARNRFCSMRVEQPRLWWPMDCGGQPVYRYRVRLLAEGICIDERTGVFAFRTVETVEEPFSEDVGAGMRFRFRVNGRFVFIKGTNWVPPEMWPAETTDEQIRFYLDKVREAHFNMVRVWGGGVYERNLFYELCDAYGILVWQDFMFASAGYPVNALRDEIVAEACWQITRLREHPCIAVFCGCNENFASWRDYESAAKSFREGNDALSACQSSEAQRSTGGVSQSDIADMSEVGRKRHLRRSHDDPILYTMLLRGLVSRYAPGIPYVESSPMSHGDAGNDPTSGNSHVSCWKYALFETNGNYAAWRGHFETVCAFDSEFCIQGPCSETYLRSFLKPEHHWPPDEAWIRHIQRGHRRLPHYEQTMRVAGATFGQIHSLPEYVKFGQATHMEQTRAEYEAARQDDPDSGGTMAWMFNDCWPTANWSVIDYSGCPKPAYYAAKRACAPLLPIIFERGGKVRFTASNHSDRTVRFELWYGAMRLDGTVLTQKHGVYQRKPGETKLFDVCPRQTLPRGKNVVWFIRGRAEGEALPSVTYFPNLWKEVPFSRSEPQVSVLSQKVHGDGFEWELSVVTMRFGRYVHLETDAQTVWFSDNWFDLLPGEPHIVRAVTDTEGSFWAKDWLDGPCGGAEQNSPRGE